MDTGKRVLLIAVLSFACYGASCQKVEDDLGGFADKVIQKADEAGVDEKIEALAPFLPTPIGEIALGLVAVGGWLRSWRNKQTALKVVKATTEASKEGKIDFTDPATQVLLSRVMGQAGKDLVSQGQGKKTGLPI